VAGRNFDLTLYRHFAAQFQKATGLDVNEHPKARLRLMRECNNVKKVLSANRDAVTPIECLCEDRDLTIRITRDEFDQLNQQNVQGVLEPIRRILESAKEDHVPLHSVEIVGGCSRIPCVQTAVLDAVKAFEPSIEKLNVTLNGEEAVARGAALMCAMLSPSYKVKEFQVCDMNYYPITLSYENDEKQPKTELVLRTGHPQPCNAKVTFHKKTTFDFRLQYPSDFKQGDIEMKAEYPFTTNKVIGEFRCEVPELSPNLAQSPKVKLNIQLSRHGILEWPAGTFIEYVRKEDEKPAEKAKEEEKPQNATPAASQESSDAPKPDSANAEKAQQGGPEPMEVDDKPEAAPQEQAKEGDANAKGPAPMEVDEEKASDEKKREETRKTKNHAKVSNYW
jgi:heat shock protein 4